ncbi:hypothetical protein WHR41_09275 [Cladosporium halotolerans]|uniref:JmjC domain-containing protein n=1 Tax=Cladosporium halotolerans TaxID=1052096 RepID=A0AB34KED0_9PEZI
MATTSRPQQQLSEADLGLSGRIHQTITDNCQQEDAIIKIRDEFVDNYSKAFEYAWAYSEALRSINYACDSPSWNGFKKIVSIVKEQEVKAKGQLRLLNTYKTQRRHLACVSMVWSPEVLSYYKWNEDDIGINPARNLYACAMKYSRFKEDFVPQMRLIWWLRHCRGLLKAQNTSTREDEFITGSFTGKELRVLKDLKKDTPTEIYGVEVTLSTAHEDVYQQQIAEWTKHGSSVIRVQGKSIDLEVARSSHWPTLLLKNDKYGALQRREQSDRVDAASCDNGVLSPPASMRVPVANRHFDADASVSPSRSEFGDTRASTPLPLRNVAERTSRRSSVARLGQNPSDAESMCSWPSGASTLRAPSVSSAGAKLDECVSVVEDGGSFGESDDNDAMEIIVAENARPEDAASVCGADDQSVVHEVSPRDNHTSTDGPEIELESVVSQRSPTLSVCNQDAVRHSVQKSTIDNAEAEAGAGRVVGIPENGVFEASDHASTDGTCVEVAVEPVLSETRTVSGVSPSLEASTDGRSHCEDGGMSETQESVDEVQDVASTSGTRNLFESSTRPHSAQGLFVTESPHPFAEPLQQRPPTEALSRSSYSVCDDSALPAVVDPTQNPDQSITACTTTTNTKAITQSSTKANTTTTTASEVTATAVSETDTIASTAPTTTITDLPVAGTPKAFSHESMTTHMVTSNTEGTATSSATTATTSTTASATATTAVSETTTTASSTPTTATTQPSSDTSSDDNTTSRDSRSRSVPECFEESGDLVHASFGRSSELTIRAIPIEHWRKECLENIGQSDRTTRRSSLRFANERVQNRLGMPYSQDRLSTSADRPGAHAHPPYSLPSLSEFNHDGSSQPVQHCALRPSECECADCVELKSFLQRVRLEASLPGASSSCRARDRWFNTSRWASVVDRNDWNSSEAEDCEVLHLTHASFKIMVDNGMPLDKPIVVGEHQNDQDGYDTEMVRRTLLDHYKGSKTSISNALKHEPETVDMEDFLELFSSGEVPVSCTTPRESLGAHHPTFMSYHRLRFLQIAVTRGMCRAAREDGNQSRSEGVAHAMYMNADLSFNRIETTGAFCAPHVGGFGGTWLRNLMGERLYAFVPRTQVTKESYADFALDSLEWQPADEPRLVRLKPNDVLLIPPGYICAHLALNPCVSVEGPFWDAQEPGRFASATEWAAKYNPSYATGAPSGVIKCALHGFKTILAEDPARFESDASLQLYLAKDSSDAWDTATLEDTNHQTSPKVGQLDRCRSSPENDELPAPKRVCAR